MPSPDTKVLLATILVAIACALGVVSCITLLEGCKPGWNDPVIPKPTPDNPCGYRWHSCGIRENGKHGCCFETDVCRPGGFCAFVGNSFGATPDGGGETLRPQSEPACTQQGAPR
jgi:hypothetical protein